MRRKITPKANTNIAVVHQLDETEAIQNSNSKVFDGLRPVTPKPSVEETVKEPAKPKTNKSKVKPKRQPTPITVTDTPPKITGDTNLDEQIDQRLLVEIAKMGVGDSTDIRYEGSPEDNERERMSHGLSEEEVDVELGLSDLLPVSDVKDGDFNPYKAVTHHDDYIDIDDDYLASNIHWEPPAPKKTAIFKPKPITDYYNAKAVFLDIEAEGLDPYIHRCCMTGIMIQGDYRGILSEKVAKQLEDGYIIEATKIEDDDAERVLLQRTWDAIVTLGADFIATHNGIKFDFPFLAKRMDILGVKHNIHILEREKKITAASQFGKPITFKPVYLKRPNYRGYVKNDGTFTQLIDTLPLAAQLDKIVANMRGYGLKYQAYYIGFRKEGDNDRVTLDYEDMCRLWRSDKPEDKQLFREYLLDDLRDQKAVSNFYVPSIWYQQTLVPLALQDMSVASPAKKWNAILETYYKQFYNRLLPNGEYFYAPVSNEKKDYEGALTDCLPGLYKFFFKIDVSSLYPSIILRYALAGGKDPMKVSEVALRLFRDLRYVFKKLAGPNPHEAKQYPVFHELISFFGDIDLDNISPEDIEKFDTMNQSLKVCINGFYGFLGVGGYPFNAVESAALVTGYGRVLMRDMRAVCEKWCNIINLDTDGLCLQPKFVDDLPDEFFTDEAIDGYASNPLNGEPIAIACPGYEDYVNPEFVWAQVQAVLPKDILIELEDNYPEGVIYAPKKKNYIYWKKEGKSPKLKGVYRKRNRTELQKEFPVKYLEKIAFESQDAADQYYLDVIKMLERGSTDEYYLADIVKQITIRQRVPKNSKELPDANVGRIGEQISFYWASRKDYTPKGRIRKWPARYPVRVAITEDNEFLVLPQDVPSWIDPNDISMGLDFRHYKEDIDKMKTDIDVVLKEQRANAGDASPLTVVIPTKVEPPIWAIA